MRIKDYDFGFQFGDVKILRFPKGLFRYEVYMQGEDEYGTVRQVAWLSDYYSVRDCVPGIAHFSLVMVGGAEEYR